MIAADTELAVGLRDVDEDAMTTLVGRYGPAVTAVVSHVLGTDAASDVVPAVFLQAWRNSEWFEPGRDFGPWLFSLTMRAAKQHGTGDLDADTADSARRVWDASTAIADLDGDRRTSLHAWYLGHEDVPTAASDVERMQRRLAYLFDDDDGHEAAAAVDELLADPDVWRSVEPGVVGSVLQAVDSEAHDGARVVVDEVAARQQAKSARTFRSVIIGLGSAMAVLVVAVVALSVLSGPPQTADFTADLIPTGEIPEVEAGSITVTERDSGVEIELDAFTLPRRGGDQFYRGVVVLDDGTELTVGSFSEGVGITLYAGVALERIVTFRVVLDGLGVEIDGNDVVLKADAPAN